VCGLKWSPDDRQIASGGNDNQLYIWNQASANPVLKFSDHTAAVKAIAWSPHQHGLLASGGGTADRCIRFWNTTTSTALNHLDTGAVLCADDEVDPEYALFPRLPERILLSHADLLGLLVWTTSGLHLRHPQNRCMSASVVGFLQGFRVSEAE
jgi:WD40 repeat protein